MEPLIAVLDRVEEARVQDLLSLFASAWWTRSRDRPAVERMLAGSDVIVCLVDRSEDRLVGFARVITDGEFLAVVLDVIVDPSRRGVGLGARLVEEILARPELRRVDSIELVCQPELIPFYKRFGFSTDVGRSTLMRNTANPVLVRGDGDATGSATEKTPS